MGRALDNGVVRNNLFTQWKEKVGSAAKACGQASAKDKGEAHAKDKGEAAAKDQREIVVHSSSGFLIPGLRCPEVAWLENYYDDINQSLVYLNLTTPTKNENEFTLYQQSYLISGSMSIKDLTDRVRYKVNLDVSCPLKFSVDGNVLSEDTRMAGLFKKYTTDDGYAYFNCVSSEDPLTSQWTLVEKKKRAKSKSASSSIVAKKLENFALSDQHREEVYVIEESVPYPKWLNWKTKGNRKKSQYVKKQQLELAMHQRCRFVETKDGPAVLSFGSYGPNGNLQFH